MANKVIIGSTVTIEVYQLGRFTKISADRQVIVEEYRRYREKENYTEVLQIGGEDFQNNETSHDSFTGRALMGAVVGEERIVNVGGGSISEIKVNSTSGNHLKYKVVAIE